MTAVFVELPAFARYRSGYLTDGQFSGLQALLMANPGAGDVIPDSGGLRKLRLADSHRGKGKRSGLRIIYILVAGWFAVLVVHYLRYLRRDRPARKAGPQRRRR